VPHIGRATYRRDANRPLVSLELWTTVASVGTFVVITATAVAAVIQLVHIKSSNQIAILTDFRESTEDPDFIAATEFVRGLDAKLEERAFRALLDEAPLPASFAPINRVGRLYETLGCFVKRGTLDADLVCDLWSPVVLGAWRRLEGTIVVMRRTRGPALFENFEYLALLSQRHTERYPSNYPKGMPRIAPPDRWAAEDGRV
jgi:hypothetical protein